MRAQLLVLAKQPLPGRAKTRLSPALGPEGAAAVARAALLDTLDAVAAVSGVARTIVLDGRPDGLVPAGFAVLPQSGGPLGARLAAAFDAAWDARPLPMLLIGMDTPQVRPDMLEAALSALLAPGADAVLGPAEDGGWWALGLRRPRAGLFDGVPMSTDRTGAAQADRMRALGLTPTPLPALRDLDEIADLHAVAALQPATARVALLVAGLDRSAA